MRSVAGTSAREQYRAARAYRRHRMLAASLLLGMSASCLCAAVGLVAAGPSSLAGTVGAVCLALACLLRPSPDPERWLRGAAGEEMTARVLDRLPARQWVVRHDLRIPGSRANLDHLVIGPSGVWVVDTKATRAQVRARWGNVRVGDRCLDPGPTRWEAQVVADRLGAPVRPLIVVHGRGLRRRGGRCGGVRVVPVTNLTRRLRRARRRLRPTDVAELARRVEAVFPPAGTYRKKGAAPRG